MGGGSQAAKSLPSTSLLLCMIPTSSVKAQVSGLDGNLLATVDDIIVSA